MRRLGYTKHVSITLQNEYYTNKGLEQEEMMRNIGYIKGVLDVEKYPINKEIKVIISYGFFDCIEEIVDEIESILIGMLIEKEESLKK